MQKLIIAGTVGRDAELRSTQGGDKVLGFSLAVDNGKDQQGNKRPATWYDCSVWGKRAESLANYIRKGDKLALEGRPTARSHDGKAYLGLSVSELTFMGGNQGNQGQMTRDQGSYDPNGGYGAGGSANSGGRDLDDEIPF